MRPDKSQLVINLKAAKALGPTVPPSLFAHADEITVRQGATFRLSMLLQLLRADPGTRERASAPQQLRQLCAEAPARAF
jgi:hypothetical protein